MTPDGPTQLVFWQGAGATLWEGWYAGGAWHGPVNFSAGFATELRDPLVQPFTSTSIWNMPIGSGAVYVNTNPVLAVVGHAGTVTVVNSATGVVSFNDSGGTFLRAASIAWGVVYIGDTRQETCMPIA